MIDECSSHYSLAQKPALLLRWAEFMALALRDKKIRQPVLVYTGMSGISAATLLSVELFRLGVNHAMTYVRKKHEQSHGMPLETHYPENWIENEKNNYIFVDDFVSSGMTFLRCEYKLAEPISFVCTQLRSGQPHFEGVMVPHDFYPIEFKHKQIQEGLFDPQHTFQ